MKKHLWVIWLVLLSNLVIAAPPFLNPLIDTRELIVVFPLNYYYAFGSNTTLNFDVLNQNLTKLDSTTTNCTFSVVNSTGVLQQYSNLSYNSLTRNWYLYKPQTDYGVHTYYVYCTSNGDLQGYITSSFEVTENGQDPTIPQRGVEITLIVFFLIIFYLWAINYLKDENFTNHGMLKSFMVILLLWVCLIPISMAIEYNIFYFGPFDITNLLELLYQIMIWINSALSFYMLIWLLINFIGKLQGKNRGDEDGEQ